MGVLAAIQSQDIMLEILSWLPPHSMIRFKSSCKLWHSIISDPYFMKIKLRRSFGGIGIILTLNTSLYYYSLESRSLLKLTDPSLSTIKNHVARITPHNGLLFFSIVSSLDGLLLYKVGVFSNQKKFVKFYYLYNPITTFFKLIPKPKTEFNQSFNHEILLIPEHKVVKLDVLRWSDDRAECVLRVYSCETGKWEFCGKQPLIYKDVLWIRNVHIPFLVDEYGFEVLYFGEFKGHLHLIISRKCGIFHFYIIEAVKDYSKWSVLYKINLNSQFLGKILCDIRFHHIIHMERGATRDYDKLVLNYENKILSYNLMDDTVSEINVPLTSNSTWSYNVYPSNCMFYRCLNS
ncbi:Transposase IS200-like protein [Dioscorea alata]|uniref:Transposase IS200-like protein n=1 Tax=Dioscorea alata TaxID=55571 RepID=A0ACB7UHQ5_DIOAL|nr:Transposase IS200-like protein [Dioscorea alata]